MKAFGFRRYYVKEKQSNINCKFMALYSKTRFDLLKKQMMYL